MIISRTNAELIARTACRDAHAEEIAKERDLESALAEECWTNVFQHEVREAALSMPEHWFRIDACLRFNAGGWTIVLEHKKGLRVPYRIGCNILGALSGGLSDRARAFVVERDKKRGERQKAQNDLLAAIRAARTFKQLAVAWPEGLPYFEKYIPKTAGGASTAIAVPFARINESLGLTPKKEV